MEVNTKEANGTPTPPMRISDLYRQRLAEAAEFRMMAKDRRVTEGVAFVRDHYRTRSSYSEVAATCLAHCVIQFGDLALHSIDFDKLRPTVKGMSCEGRNPFLWGLDDIERFLVKCAENADSTHCAYYKNVT